MRVSHRAYIEPTMGRSRPVGKSCAQLALFGSDDAVELPIEVLVERMSRRDRGAAAEFLRRCGPRLRRRIRGKMNATMRRVFDSEDILSTLARRLDLLIMAGGLHLKSEAELRSLMFSMAEHAVIDKVRTFARYQRLEARGLGDAHRLPADITRQCTDDTAEQQVIDIDSCLRAVVDPCDRRILFAWLAGESQRTIAKHTALSIATVRRHWQRIKAKLRQVLAQ